MSLEIVAGRSKSGKSKYIYDKIFELLKDGKEVILVVPEQYSHIAEKRLLEKIDVIEDNKSEVFSFNRLAQITEQRLGIPSKPQIDSVGKALTIRNILKNNDFKFYKTACETDGFVDLISQTICEFKKYMILPEALCEKSMNCDNPILSMKLSDLSHIYGEYEKSIANKYFDSDDSLTILAKRLENSDIYKNKYVFFDEFSTFIPQEYNVIANLCKGCKQVVMSLTYDPNEKNSTLFMPTADTIGNLRKYVGQDIKITQLDNSCYKSDELSFLEKNLYNFSNKKYNGICNNIKVYGVSNPKTEVEICSYEIMKLIKNEGYSYKDIGIVCSDLEVYERHIERVFDQSKIEYFIDNKKDVINHHIVRFILGLIEVYMYDYNYSSVFNYLKAAFAGADSASISLLEKYIKKTNLRRTSWLSDDKWNNLLNANYPNDEYSRNIINSIRNKYIVPLAKMHEKIKGRNSVKSNMSALYELLIELKLPDTLEYYINMFDEKDELRYSKEYEKMWEIVVDTFDKIVLLSGDSVVNVKDFYEILYTAFSQNQIGFIPSAIDRIIIGNTERTRTDELKVLFILGVNEGVFPVAPKPDGVLTDSDKESLKEDEIMFSTTSSIAAFYSQFSAYTAFTMPSEKLFVSYSKSNNDFKAIYKSYIVDKLLKMFSLKENNEFSLSVEDMLTNPEVVRDKLADTLSKSNSENQPDTIWKHIYMYYKNNTEFISKINKFVESDNICSNLSDENLKKLISILSYTSVSKLERYMSCKYAYFIDYILKIEQLKEEQVDALDIGNVTHRILEKLSLEFGKTRESFVTSDDEAILKRIEELISEEVNVFSGKIDEISSRNAYVIKRLKNAVFLCFMAIKKQFVNSKFEPLGFEIEFGAGSELGPISIETPRGENVILTGKIDRADIYNCGDKAYVRVIDYKTGAKEFKLDDVLYGLSLQLMVYLNKLVSSNDCYDYGGALYFPVIKPLLHQNEKVDDEFAFKAIEAEFKLKGIAPYDDTVLSGYEEKFADSLKHGSAKNKRVSLQGFETIDKYLNKKIGCICDDILSGDISISPVKKGNHTPCDYCKYNSICRFDTSQTGNDFTHYKSKNIYEDIIKEMEETLSVDN